MPKIDRIRIHHFRGASAEFDVKFAKGKKLVVIFGENGTGKTTIVDALDAVGNCSGGSLTTKSSTTLRDHLPTAGRKAADMVVEVSAGGTTWQAALKRNEIIVTPSARPAIHVLRRTNLQRFIESQPARRYEEVRHLIGVEQVERAEGSLKRASDEVKQALDDAARTSANAEIQLERIWEAEGSPGHNWRSWARGEARQDPSELIAKARTLRGLGEVINDSLRAREEWQGSESALALAQREFGEVEAKTENQPGIDTRRAMDVAEMLGRVRTHLAADQEDRCPVCGQDVKLDDLKAELDERLGDLTRYQALSAERKSVQRRLETAGDAVQAKRSEFIAATRRIVDAVRGMPAESVPPAMHATLAPVSDGATSDPDDPLAHSAAVTEACSSLLAPLQAGAEAASGAAGRVNAIRELYAGLEESRETSIELERVLKGLAAAHDLVKSTRIEYTQRILDDVAEECNRLYAAIHPGEGLAISKIELDQRQRASLSQMVNFGEHSDVPPQAYFSEAHLDTLGFCFWLAFAKRENSDGEGILVLDDVFTSVDSQHRRRLAELVVKEGAHFSQVIITTHDRNWHDYFRNPHGPGNLTEVFHLQPWSIDKGISSYRTVLAVEDLRNAIDAAPFERQVVASKAGVLLEATLDWLALQYRCRVARTMDNVYDLGELLAGTASLFKCLELEKPVLDSSGQPGAPSTTSTVLPKDILSGLQTTVLVRNQVGAHHNVYGAGLADSDVREFAALTVDLVQALVCPVCGQIPSTRTGTHYKCSCPEPKAVHMKPLQLGN